MTVNNMPARTLALTEVSGREFEVHPRRSTWNHVPGVYLILQWTLGGDYRPLYVGQTDDLADRHAAHHKAGCFDSYGWTHLAFLFERNEWARRSIEADLLTNYHWPCNG